MMSDPSVNSGKPRRRLSPSEKYQLFVEVLTGQATQREAAAKWGVDRSSSPLAELDQRDLTSVREGTNRPPKTLADTVDHRRRRDRETPGGQELDHLPTHLQVRHIPVEINPIQALDVQTHMPIENIRCRHRPLRHAAPLTPA
jgi:transposase-like protein